MAKAPKTTTAPTGQIAPFGLRMLPELREKIEAAARESGRSMNAEIVARLESSLDGSAGASADQIVKEMEFVRHMYERESKALSATQKLLAELLKTTTNALEEEGVKGDLIRISRNMAEGILQSDAGKLADAYADIFPKIKGTGIFEELHELDAKKKRGEDITPYVEKFVVAKRADWEAGRMEKSLPAKKSAAVKRAKK
jgi:hypothetical protein